MSDTTDNIFFSGEKMEETEKEEITFWQTVKKDFIQNAAKYVTNAIIFAIFFIGSAFLLGFKFTSEKLSGALTEPVANQVVNKIMPEFKTQFEALNTKIQGIQDYQDRQILKDVNLDKIEIDKYYMQMNDKSINLNTAHQKKLEIYYNDIPKNLMTKDIEMKFHAVDDFISAKTMLQN